MKGLRLLHRGLLATVVEFRPETSIGRFSAVSV